MSLPVVFDGVQSACFCRISQHQQVYLSTIEYQRASLRILPIENYNLPFMRPKIPYLSSLLVTCHQSSRLYGVILWGQIVVNLKHKFRFSEIEQLINRHYLQSFHGLVNEIHIIIKNYPACSFL